MRRSQYTSWLAAALVAVAVPACAADPPPARTRPAEIAPPNRIPDVVAPTPAGETVNIASVPKDVRRAVAAAAARLMKVDENAVVLTRAERVTWNDGSLGCPRPGQMYTQMLVEGFRVVARSNDAEVVYHTDTRGQAVACTSPGNGPARKLGDRIPTTAPQPAPRH
jgi:hypothetical protein